MFGYISVFLFMIQDDLIWDCLVWEMVMAPSKMVDSSLIRLGCELMEVANVLAYYDTVTIINIKNL
jgi:hypothetical protein